MNIFIDSPLWSSLVLSLPHSLWQGALISVLLWAALRWTPSRHANPRYGLAVGALGLLVCGWLATWTWIERKQTAEPAAAALAGPMPGAAEHGAEFVSMAGEEGRAREQRAGEAPAGRATSPLVEGLDSRWRAWAGLVWLMGVILFQARVFVLAGRARGLVRQSRPVAEPAALEAFNRMLGRYGLTGRVELWRSEGVGVPAAWGFLKPVVLIPSSYLTGMTPGQLEAVLAHELAHIRRHDFAVNLGQMAIEALFFFNPFVWWISARIRLEREACCDTMAVEKTGERLGYARVLTEIAEAGFEQGSGPEPVLAMGRERGELFDRVRRLLQPQGAPQLRLPLASVAGVILLCGVGLFLLKTTTSAALEMLSPVERVNRFAELRSQYPDHALRQGAPSDEEAERFTVRGILRTHDGRPIPRRNWIRITSRAPGHTTASTTQADAEGAFSHEIRAGTIYLSARLEGYGPAFAGPLEKAEDWENVELVLEPGSEASIRLVDGAGNPVSGGRVTARHEFPANSWNAEAISDDQGLVALEQMGSKPVSLEVKASRFQLDHLKGVSLQPGEVLSWELEPSEVTAGWVLFEETGEPVAGARIHLGRRTGAMAMGHARLEASNFLTETDGEGRFELDWLRDDARYHLLITGPGASGIVAGPIRAGDQNLRFRLPRAQFLAVRAENVTESHLDNRGRLRLNYSVTMRYGDTSYVTSEPFYAMPENGVAQFEAGPLWKLDGGWRVGDQAVQLTWEQIVAQAGPIVIDLAAAEEERPADQPLTRTLRLALRTADGKAAPQGAVVVRYSRDGHLQHVPAEVREGRAELEITVPSRVELLPSSLAGYWFPPKTVQVPSEEGPFEFEIELHPAGAIHGEVLEEDGRPAEGLMISVISVEPLPAGAGSNLGVTVKNRAFSGDRESQFLAGPLPFGGSYVICAHRFPAYVLTEPLPVNPETPFHQVTLTLPKGVEIAGTVLRPDGTAFARREVTLHFSPTAGHGFSGPPAVTDREGRFSFANVNPDAQGRYRVEVKLDRDYQPAGKMVVPGERLEFRLEEGLVIEGRVIDAESGVALEGAELFAMRRLGAPGADQWTHWYDAEGATDGAGRFRFSNLAPGQYMIGSRSGQIRSKDQTREAGSGESLVLAIEPHPWSKVKKGSGPLF